jgi:two-component system sensor histidine kinase KdpD
LRYRIVLDAAVQAGATLVPTAVRTVGSVVPGDVVFVEEPDGEPWWATAAGLATAWADRRTLSRQVDEHEVLLLPVTGQHGVVGILAVRASSSRLSDTERRLLGVAATELGRLHERASLLDAAATSDRLRASDEAKSALLAAVSHDLRTPLGAIKVTISALLEQSIGIPPARAKELLETADREVDRLTSMIDHLLDLSRFEAGAFRLDRDRVSIADLLGEAITRVEIASGRTFESNIVSDLALEGDAVRLLEAVTNVLENAARYSEPSAPIAVRANRDGSNVQIVVADSGRGLTRQQRARLFQPFWRGNASGAGSGLGLAISRSIIAAHGGSIDVESRRGVGTTVTIVLPERPPD